MTTALIVTLLTLLILAYIWYVKLISRRNEAKEALSGIDVQLKKRANLVPNILKLTQKYMDHEMALMTEITELRTHALRPYDANSNEAIKEHFQSVEKLNGKMADLMISVENYPDLKSDTTMLHAQETYNEVEAQISAARRFYNAAVTQLNNTVEIFPGNLIAGFVRVHSMPFYEVEAENRGPIDADDYMK